MTRKLLLGLVILIVGLFCFPVASSRQTVNQSVIPAKPEVQQFLSVSSTSTRLRFNTWFSPDASSSSLIQGQTQPPAIPPGDFGKVTPPGSWTFSDTKNGKVRFWWQPTTTDAAVIDSLMMEMDSTIWPGLTTLMGREPLSDEAEIDRNGGDGKLDIVLGDTKTDKDFLDDGIAQYYDANKDPSPMYIIINRSAATKYTVAHEFMHVLQNSFKNAWIRSNKWLSEATATWAEYFLYRDDPDPADYADSFLANSNWSLEEFTKDIKHAYGAYLFFLYITEGGTKPEIIRTIWENTDKSDSLEAIDLAMQSNGLGGFDKVWPKFVVQCLNFANVNNFTKWDANLLGKQTRFDLERLPNLKQTGDEEVQFKVMSDNSEVVHLSASYFHLTFDSTFFPGSDIPRSVSFNNGFTYESTIGTGPGSYPFSRYQTKPLPERDKQGATVQALLKFEGRDWALEDWTNVPERRYCLDMKSERLEQLVVMQSNSEFKNRGYFIKSSQLPSTVWVSNLGCWQWKGTLKASQNSPNYSSTATGTDVVLGRGDIGVTCLGYLFLGFPGHCFKAIGGNFSKRIIDDCTEINASGGNLAKQYPLYLFAVMNFVPQGQYKRVFIGTKIGPLGAPATVTNPCKNESGSGQTDIVIPIPNGASLNGAGSPPVLLPAGTDGIFDATWSTKGISGSWHLEPMREP